MANKAFFAAFIFAERFTELLSALPPTPLFFLF